MLLVFRWHYFHRATLHYTLEVAFQKDMFVDRSTLLSNPQFKTTCIMYLPQEFATCIYEFRKKAKFQIWYNCFFSCALHVCFLCEPCLNAHCTSTSMCSSCYKTDDLWFLILQFDNFLDFASITFTERNFFYSAQQMRMLGIWCIIFGTDVFERVVLVTFTKKI